MLLPPADNGGAAVGSAEWWRPAAAAHGPVETVLPAEVSEEHAGGGVVAFRALMVFTFVMLIAPQAYVPALRPFRIALVAAVVGIAAGLADRIRRGQPLSVGGREMALATGLLTWAVVTLPLSYWPGGSASFLLDTFFKTVATFWLLGNVVDTLPRLRRVAWGLALMAVPMALAGIKNFRAGVFIGAGDPVKRIGGYEAGLTANPNDLALMLNIILPITVALVAVTRSALVRAALVSIILLEVTGVVVTFSRAGFLTLASIFALYLWRSVRDGHAFRAMAAAALALAVLLVAPGGYLERLATIADIDSDPTGSAQARWGDTVAAAKFVMDHPVFGAGAGMNILALNDVRGVTWTQVHNLYLQYAADLGLPGLALFLLLLRACLRRVRSIRREPVSSPALAELSALAGGIEIALLGFVVAAFFYPVGYHVYFFYPAGLAVAAGVLHETAAAQARPQQLAGLA